MTTKTTRYLSAAETAKLVRRALKERFPGQKFSVRTHTYAGGASIDVRWTDGPRAAVVEPVVKVYEGSDFDGMIDLKVGITHYLRPDGRVLVAKHPGTVGGRGSLPGEDNTMLEPVLPDDAERVHFGADYIFCYREISDRETKVAAADAYIREHVMVDRATRPEYDRFGNHYISDLANTVARDTSEGEPIDRAFRRVVLRERGGDA